ncbi:pLS20_p028 family conjugation system transmembrane protein, partial [Caldibacillus thermoamylovorans]|uniref:pLS20_p028 family conjugation system transmembrane protein n=1 Tax=Caldibacillus thermoamylovorans TaxID=35841 RepID=UPI0005A454D2
MFRNGKKKIIIVYIMLTLLCLTLVFYIPNASASMWDGVWSEDTEDIVNFLLGHSNWLQFGNFITVTLHQIAWLFIKGLYMITSAIEGLIPESLNLLNFLDDSGMQGLFKAIINDLVSVLMILTIVYLGFKTVIAKEPPNFKSVGVNIFLSAFLILGLPSLMDTMEDVSLKFYDATQKAGNNSSANLSWNLIQNNTADLMYAADKGFDLIENDSDGTGSKNALTPETFFVVDLSEVITPKVIDKIDSPDSSIKSLKYKLSTDSNGKYTATEIDGGVLSFFSDSFDPGYFRYPAKFLPIIAGLIALVVAYIFTIFVFASTALEIGFKQVLAPIIFATDLETGQRTKMVVKDIGNAFMLIAFTGLSFRLYTMFLSFLGSSNINILIYVTAMIAATFILIKGSSTIMRYFGVDVGLKDGFAQIAGAFAIGRSTAHVGKSLRNLTKSGKKNDSPNSNKDALSDHVDSTRSVNDSKKGIGNTLKKSVNSAGKTVGYMRERGITGMAEDAIKGTGEKIGNNINSKMKSLTDGAKGIKDSWKQGIEEGELNGLGNQIKWKQQQGKQEKSINDSDSSLSYEDKGFLKSNDNNKNDTQKQKLQHDINSINSSATSNISSDMKINPSVSGINGNSNISS